MEDSLKIAVTAISKGGLLNQVTPEELAEAIEGTNIEAKDADKLASVLVYINNRFIEGKSRFESFSIAFPERCVPQEDTNPVPFPNTNPKKVSRTAIEVKAKRIEQSKMYKATVSLMQTNLYISYALQRMEVLDMAMGKIRDDFVSDREKVQYMKVFLEETRKPVEAKGMELNVNVQQNQVNLVAVEDKLSDLSAQLLGKPASEVIEMLQPSGES